MGFEQSGDIGRKLPIAILRHDSCPVGVANSAFPLRLADADLKQSYKHLQTMLIEAAKTGTICIFIALADDMGLCSQCISYRLRVSTAGPQASPYVIAQTQYGRAQLRSNVPL